MPKFSFYLKRLKICIKKNLLLHKVMAIVAQMPDIFIHLAKAQWLTNAPTEQATIKPVVLPAIPINARNAPATSARTVAPVSIDAMQHPSKNYVLMRVIQMKFQNL